MLWNGDNDYFKLLRKSGAGVTGSVKMGWYGEEVF
jgi:hypothetical protein